MRAPLFTALGWLVAFVIVIAYQSIIDEHTVPTVLRFVPADTNVFLITSDLETLWAKGLGHGKRLLADPLTTLGRRMNDTYHKQFVTGCLPLISISDFRQYGIATDKELAFAIRNVESGNSLLALPLKDVGKFVVFLRMLEDQPREIVLSGAVEGKPLRAIRIDEVESDGLRICGTNQAEPIQIVPGAAFEVASANANAKELRFGAAPDLVERALFRARCTAQYFDGTEGPCVCRLEEKDCSLPVVIAPLHLPFKPLWVGDKALSGMTFKNGTVVAIMDDNYALFGDSSASLVQAAANPTANRRFFRTDDNFIGNVRWFSSSQHDAALILGQIRPAEPFLANISLTAQITDDTLTILSFLSVQDWGSTILRRLTERNRIHGENALPSLSTHGAHAYVTDPNLGYYIQFVIDYVEDARNELLKSVGNFAVFIDELARIHPSRGLAVTFLGIREGTPDIVGRLRVASDEEASDLVFRQQRKIRLSRDLAVLRGALAAARTRSAPKSLEDLQPYLFPEPDALWDRYLISDDAWHLKERLDLAPSDFSGDTYAGLAGDRPIRFIPPPITENDLTYRFSEAERVKLDIDALQRNRFRMAAYYDPSARCLYIGSDADSLSTALQLSRVERDTGDETGNAKFILRTDPAWLIEQILGYPDRDLREAIEKDWVFLDQYRSLAISLRGNDSDEGTLSLEIKLGHGR